MMQNHHSNIYFCGDAFTRGFGAMENKGHGSIL